MPSPVVSQSEPMLERSKARHLSLGLAFVEWVPALSCLTLTSSFIRASDSCGAYAPPQLRDLHDLPIIVHTAGLTSVTVTHTNFHPLAECCRFFCVQRDVRRRVQNFRYTVSVADGVLEVLLGLLNLTVT